MMKLFSGDDDCEQKAELKHARADRRSTWQRLRDTLAECHNDSVKLTNRLADAVQDAEGIETLDDSSPGMKLPKVHDEDCDMGEDCTCGASSDTDVLGKPEAKPKPKDGEDEEDDAA